MRIKNENIPQNTLFVVIAYMTEKHFFFLMEKVVTGCLGLA